MKKNFKNINTTLGKLLEQYNLSHVYSLETIKKDWSNMDKTIAAHSAPVEYDPKTKILKLKIENISWKKEFIENREMFLAKTKAYFKTIEIHNIEFI
ncbi:MAG: hypothetical protein D8M58_08655 [Calditrichaeota bacterium]|nr:MAG: hypothetical protein DWQ03_17835 [Calditrichota bacterium]MBL1205453.1 hypothetical protein [Calditrichota bacterium]NOG45282.1 hypothetical protein [Calditrichota bacterium]